jgi:hypothetical protein
MHRARSYCTNCMQRLPLSVEAKILAVRCPLEGQKKILLFLIKRLFIKFRTLNWLDLVMREKRDAPLLGGLHFRSLLSCTL